MSSKKSRRFEPKTKQWRLLQIVFEEVGKLISGAIPEKTKAATKYGRKSFNSKTKGQRRD